MMRIALVLSLSIAACLPLPPEHTYADERSITVAWTLNGPNDDAGRCPAGYDTILVEACTNEDLYECFRATTACDATGAQSVQVYTAGRYRPDDDSAFWELGPQYWVYLSLTDPTTETKHTSSMPVRVDVSSGDKRVESTLYPEAGFLRLDWRLTSAASGNEAVDCAEYGVDEIELQYAKHTSSEPVLDKNARWPCANRVTSDPDASFLGDRYSPALAPGSYIGDAVAYRNGAEVGRYEDISFTIEPRGEVSSQSAYIEISDR